MIHDHMIHDSLKEQPDFSLYINKVKIGVSNEVNPESWTD